MIPPCGWVPDQDKVRKLWLALYPEDADMINVSGVLSYSGKCREQCREEEVRARYISIKEFMWLQESRTHADHEDQ